MDTEQALSLINQVLDHDQLRLSRKEHAVLAQAFNHIKEKLMENSDD